MQQINFNLSLHKIDDWTLIIDRVDAIFKDLCIKHLELDKSVTWFIYIGLQIGVLLIMGGSNYFLFYTI